MNIKYFIRRHKITLRRPTAQSKYRFGRRLRKDRVLDAISASGFPKLRRNAAYQFGQLRNDRYAARLLVLAFAIGFVISVIMPSSTRAAPVIESVTATIFNTNTTTHNVNMPSAVEAGDLLLLLLTTDGNATVTDPDGAGGWTEIDTLTRSTFVRGSVWAKVAVGTEGSTQVNFATSATEQAVAQVYRISGWYGDLTDGLDSVSVDPGGTTSSPNPASLDPSAWDVEDTLWLVYAGGSCWNGVTSYPSGYSSGTHNQNSTCGTAGASASSAYLESETSSEDPGAFTMGSTSSGVAFTIAIRPEFPSPPQLAIDGYIFENDDGALSEVCGGVRPSVEATGSVITHNSSSTSSSTSVTVPADADYMLVYATIGNNNQADASFSLNSVTLNNIELLATNNEGTSVLSGLAEPDTGSQTFAWSWTEPVDQGATYIIRFLKTGGTSISIRDSDISATDISESDSVTLTDEAGDFLWAGGFSYDAGLDSDLVFTGVTEIADEFFNELNTGAGENDSSSGSSTITVSDTGSDDIGVAAVALYAEGCWDAEPIDVSVVATPSFSDGTSTTYQTSSLSPTSELVYYVFIATGDISIKSPSSVTGWGLTWEQVVDQDAGGSGDECCANISWYRASGSTAGGQLSINYASAPTMLEVTIVEVSGVPTTGNGADSLRNPGVSQGDSSTATHTLPAFNSAANGTIGAVVFANDETPSLEGDWTNLNVWDVNDPAGQDGGNDDGDQGGRVMWRSDNDTTVSSNWYEAERWAIAGAELVADSGGTSGMVDVTITANSDIGAYSSAQFYDWGSFGDVWLGFDEGVDSHVWMRFPSVDVPQGATIDAAHISWPSGYVESSGSINSDVYFVDEDDHTAPTSQGQAQSDAGTLTTATAAWDFSATSSPGNTPSLVDLVQEIVDRTGWLSGNDMGVQILSDNSAGTQGLDAKPTLHIEYSTAPSSGGSESLVEGATALAGSEFSSGTTLDGVRQGERMNLRMHLSNSGGALNTGDELALFYDRGDGIWSKIKSSFTPSTGTGTGCDDTAWACDAIAAVNDSGRHNSMAIDEVGHPWVSYRETSNAQLMIARYVGREGSGCSSAAWTCQVIDSDTDSGEYSSIAFGVDSDVWVSYWDDNADDLRVANFVTAGGNCDDLYGGSDAWNCTVVDSSGSVGEYSSIAVDSGGTPWISYHDATNTRLKVARYVGSGGSGCASGAWDCTVVENTGVEGQYSSITFDADGKPWVSYYHSSSTELKVARYVGSGGSGCASVAWTCYVVDSDNDSGQYSSIAFAPDGSAHVSYWNQTSNDLRMASFVESGGNCDDSFSGSDAWDCLAIDTANNVGQSTSLAFSPGGEPWISYSDSTNNTVRLARYVGSGGSGCATAAWQCGAIDSVTPAADGGTSLAFDQNGKPWATYFDESNDSLLFARLASRAGEVILSASPGLEGGAALDSSHSDMTSADDTSSQASADCLSTGTWNNGVYFESENGTGQALPDGNDTAQCTEVMWTLDTSQAQPGTTYRFVVASADGFRPDRGKWRGPAETSVYPELTMAVDEASTYRYSKDTLAIFSNCNTASSWGCINVDTTDGGGEYTASAVDSQGNIWTSFYETTGDNLVVARYVGSGGTGCAQGAWTCYVIDTDGNVGQHTSIAFDQAGAAWVSYYDVTNGDLKIARFVGSGGTGCDIEQWHCATVDSAGDTGQYTSIGFDSAGKAWISYYNVTDSDLEYARYIGTAGTGCTNIAWACNTIESEDDIGSHSSLAFDAEGMPWVSYYDATNDDLKVARYTGLGDSTTCGIASGGGGSVTPSLLSITTSEFNSDPTTHNVAMPTTVEPGDFLVIVWAQAEAWNSSANGPTTPSGWTDEFDFAFPDSSFEKHRGDIFSKVAVGNEDGSTVNVATSTGVAGTAHVYRFEAGTVSGNMEFSTVEFEEDNATTNPPSLTPSWGSAETFWVAVAALGTSWSTDTFPTSYTNTTQSEADGTEGIGLATASRLNETATEDPSSFQFGSTDNTFSYTMGLEPGTGGGGGGENNWDCETVDATGDVGQYTSIAMDADGSPWVSYYDATGGNLEVVEYVGNSGDCDSVGGGSDAWDCTSVDTTDDVGQYTSIAFDSIGSAWISYHDVTNTDLNIARYVGSGGSCNDSAWDCTDISSSSAGSNQYTSIVFDHSGLPWISYESTSSNSLGMAKLHLPPNPLSSGGLYNLPARSAGSGDLRYRLTPGTSPYTDPYGTCAGSSALTGYCGSFHPEGHTESITAEAGQRPTFAFSTRYDNNSTVPAARVYFQTDTSPAANDVVLQVYRHGSTDAWETVATYDTAGCDTENCVLTYEPTGTTSEYLEADGSYYWMHYRLYQEESSTEQITLKLDSFTAPQTQQQMRHGRVFRDLITDPLRW